LRRFADRPSAWVIVAVDVFDTVIVAVHVHGHGIVDAHGRGRPTSD
jgi:hypothetical protein